MNQRRGISPGVATTTGFGHKDAKGIFATQVRLLLGERLRVELLPVHTFFAADLPGFGIE